MTARLPLSFACVAVVAMRVAAQPDPFLFLHPAIHFSDDDTRELRERGIVAHILPSEGHELALMVVTTVHAGPDTFAASVRQIAALETNALVPEVGRFSARPRIEDLQGLTLNDADIEEIRSCRPSHCALKLQPAELTRLQHAASADTMFRQILVERAATYLHRGAAHDPPFTLLLHHAPYVESRLPDLANYLARYPMARAAGVESFLYWSKANYASKPMITISHVTLVTRLDGADAPEALVVSREIFSSRYTSGSLVTTLLFRNPESPSRRYLVYINRTSIDALNGLLRPFIEHRVKSQAARLFADRRDHIERTVAARRTVQ
jgi:hypothetical protein